MKGEHFCASWKARPANSTMGKEAGEKGSKKVAVKGNWSRKCQRADPEGGDRTFAVKRKWGGKGRKRKVRMASARVDCLRKGSKNLRARLKGGRRTSVGTKLPIVKGFQGEGDSKRKNP